MARRPALLLGDLLAQTAALSPSDRLSWQSWREIVGTKIASRSKPGSFDGSVLIIVVTSPLWANELSLLSTTILERVRSKLPRAQSLRFQVGQVEPTRLDKARPEVAPCALPAELEQRISELGDESLEAVIRNAASYNLGLARATASPRRRKGNEFR